MTHIVAGYPNMQTSENLGMLMAEIGVDFIEIQIPFSDPIADGPVIMEANQKSLEKGTKVDDCFNLLKRLNSNFKKKNYRTKLLFMTYYNIIHKMGVEKFCKEAAECGCYGLIVPDMPFDEEENEHFLEICNKYSLNPIQVISPITPPARLIKIAKIAKGFVYCVSRFGTTGVRSDLNPKLKSYLGNVKKHIKLPLAVGFGISDKNQVKAVHKHAEIAVIGSAILKLLDSKEK